MKRLFLWSNHKVTEQLLLSLFFFWQAPFFFRYRRIEAYVNGLPVSSRVAGLWQEPVVAAARAVIYFILILLLFYVAWVYVLVGFFFNNALGGFSMLQLKQPIRPVFSPHKRWRRVCCTIECDLNLNSLMVLPAKLSVTCFVTSSMLILVCWIEVAVHYRPVNFHSCFMTSFWSQDYYLRSFCGIHCSYFLCLAPGFVVGRRLPLEEPLIRYWA